VSVERFLFLTVSEASDLAAARLEQLLASVERQGVSGDAIVIMRGADVDCTEPRGKLTVHVVAGPRVIGLSAARNSALCRARELGLLARADAVAFPDDDAAYPDGLLGRVAGRLGAEAPIVCGPYAPAVDRVDRRRFPSRAVGLTPRRVMRVVSSNNVFFDAAVVRAVGDFDERLGLGAPYGAGEDSDYLLRAIGQGFPGVYRPDLIVLHPYKAHRVAEYYPGNVAVLALHGRSWRTAGLLVRRLATGAALVVRRRLPPDRYASVLRSAAALW
jgi:glycosyltransferase involved in cell wall biosynthesis